MLSKFTSQNGRILPLKIQTNQSEKKNMLKIKIKIKINDELKTRSSEYRAERTNKDIGSFEVKIHLHPMLETPLIAMNISQN